MLWLRYKLTMDEHIAVPKKGAALENRLSHTLGGDRGVTAGCVFDCLKNRFARLFCKEH